MVFTSVSVSGRHVLITEAIKTYACEKVKKLEHYSKDILDVAITMDIQRQEHRVDILVRIGHFVIKVHASSNDMYASIDRAVDKLVAKFMKYKSRMQAHHNKDLTTVSLEADVIRAPFRQEDAINDDIEEENFKELEEDYTHQIISRESVVLKTLTADEAVMKMDLSGDPFLIYRSEEDQNVKVIYRRKDGDYNLVAPR